ncbi:MAG: hypothetical protein MUF56_07215 [Solirubrobacteraceae bacterium]|jgi:hypothetical protein|nr:hypothetical protein [Solirubrobacteraceae bacterium]
MLVSPRRVRTRPARRGRCAVAVPLALLLLALAAGPSFAGSGGDSLRLRIEVGASAEYTNELYYVDEFVDTTFLERRLVDDPELVPLGVAYAALAGARGGGTTSYVLENELGIGSLLQRDRLALRLVHDAIDWRLGLVPRVEWRHDRTLGRDLTEQRAGVTGGARRLFPVSGLVAEASAGAEWLRASGLGSGQMPDRDVLSGLLALDQASAGSDWRLSGGYIHRAFPDSVTRDHHEWWGEGRTRLGSLARLSFDLDGGLVRRLPARPAPTTRDDFLEVRGGAGLVGRLGSSLGWRVRGEAEALRYAEPDSTLYFDYEVGRLVALLRHDGGRWSLEGGPRLEALRSPANAGEGYDEFAGVIELTLFAPGAWWSFEPVFGRRRYQPDPSLEAIGYGSLRSTYTFLEANVTGDQPLGAGLRLRALVSGRHEWHTDGSQDATSLYFSLDLRRLF